METIKYGWLEDRCFCFTFGLLLPASRVLFSLLCAGPTIMGKRLLPWVVTYCVECAR